MGDLLLLSSCARICVCRGETKGNHAKNSRRAREVGGDGKGREGSNFLLLSLMRAHALVGEKEERTRKRDETKKKKLEEAERQRKFPSWTFAEVRIRKVMRKRKKKEKKEKRFLPLT